MMVLKLIATVKAALQKVQPEARGWAKGEFLWGTLVVAEGLKDMMQHGHSGEEKMEIVAVASKRLRFFGIVFSACSFIVVAILWLMVVCLLWVFSWVLALFNDFTQPWLLQVALESLSFKYVLQAVGFFVPHCTILFLRYWAYQDQDRVFVAVLRKKGHFCTETESRQVERLADALETLPAESMLVWLKRYMLSVCNKGSLALALLVLTAVPRVGRIVFAGLLFLKRGSSVGFVPAVVLQMVYLLPETSLLPSGCMLAAWGTQIILTARSTATELLYPMMSRANKKQRHLLSSRYRARITGFGVAAATVLNIPILGPLFWFHLVQLAAQLLRSIVLAETDALFDLTPAVEQFKLEQAQKEQAQKEKSQKKQVNERNRIWGEAH